MTVRSEDAPVNPGAATWPSYGEAFVAVRRMQNKLHCWADVDRVRRFDDLYNLVCDPKVLTMAWERVAGNTGARLSPVGNGVPMPGAHPGDCCIKVSRSSCTQ